MMVALASLMSIAGCEGKREKGGTIQIKGSDTEVNLAQRLAESFMEKHPEVSISVTGGGSGTGIAALINRRTDIANSSREMKPEEIDSARQKGINPMATIFARDGIVLIVHQDNPVRSLTLEEAGKIFKGEVTLWNIFAGLDMEVSLYGRQSNSGTYIYFRDRVLKGDYSPQMKMMNGNAQIVEGVKRDRGGIGYVGIAYVVRDGQVVEGIRVLGIIQDPGGEAISPLDTGKMVQGNYRLFRPLYQYTDGAPQGIIAEFIRFELSPEGQKLIAQEGFYPNEVNIEK